MTYLEQLPYGFKNEKERDERCEDVLGELGEVPHKDRTLEEGHRDCNDGQPNARPQSPGQEVQPKLLGELEEGLVEQENGAGDAGDDEWLAGKQVEHDTGDAAHHQGLGDS